MSKLRIKTLRVMNRPPPKSRMKASRKARMMTRIVARMMPMNKTPMTMPARKRTTAEAVAVFRSALTA
jgi:hypothetical protein